MVQKTLEICLSETHASGSREAHTKFFISRKIDSRCNGDNAQGFERRSQRRHIENKR